MLVPSSKAILATVNDPSSHPVACLIFFVISFRSSVLMLRFVMLSVSLIGIWIIFIFVFRLCLLCLLF